MTTERELRAEIKRLKKQVSKLRGALAPFAALNPTELRPGDRNRARRVLEQIQAEEEAHSTAESTGAPDANR